jgi:D-alanine-D-alanine ligase
VDRAARAGGEDGLMQGALEWLGVPYTGSGVLASALTMDKLKTKRVVVGAGLLAPDYAVLTGIADLPRALSRIGLPLMIKPASQGSSVGITKVKTAEELPRAYAEARAVDPIVFAETFVSGPEYTVGVLQDRGLPSIRIEPATEFYDYEAKYFRDDTQYHCPSGLDARRRGRAAGRGARDFSASPIATAGDASTSCATRHRPFFFIEINTTPGMTDHSLVPKAARQIGIDFEELVWRVLETSFLEGAQMIPNWLSGAIDSRTAPRSQPEAALAELADRLAQLRPQGRGARAHRCCSARWLGAEPAGARDFDGRYLPARLAGADREGGAPFLDSGFMSADLDAASSARSKPLPWVDHARVQRRWPTACT